VSLRADQVLVGLGITIAGGGLTGYLYRELYGRQQSLGVRVHRLDVSGLSEIPVVGPAFFDQTFVVYLSWALVPLASFALFRTRMGLKVRAVGESPFGADASGVSVARVRYIALLIGGLGAGLGGAFLSVVELRFFTPGMTVGVGFIALAITMLGGWRPYRILAGAVVFGLLRSLETGLPIVGFDIRVEFLQMVPYLGIVLALVILARRTTFPAAFGLPYERGVRQ
jgi:simple sugar transport system permease protein